MSEMRCSSASNIVADTRTISGRAAASASSSALATRGHPSPNVSAKSRVWTALVIDTNGNGKRDEYTEPNQPPDPSGHHHAHS
jgi:hypothetical protein